jgi:ABC-2 type transport system ATP-binding protein
MIEVRGLSKRYGPTLAVDDLTFDVVPGQVTGFLGPNGAGKSTTMRLILGLDAPTAGTATVGGTPYGAMRRPLFEVGATLESAAIHPGRSARSHLLALAESSAIPRSRVDEVVELVGLDAVGRRRAGGFSLGMTQRLGVAAALLGDPGVLLLDEPVNGLDPEGIVWIRNLLRSLADEGRTVFVSSHLMSEMAQTAHHLIVIGRGRLVADTSVEDFVRQSSGGHVRVRSPQHAMMAELLRAEGATVEVQSDKALAVSGVDTAEVGELAARHAVVLHELVAQEASLEEAFMELTRDAVDYRVHAPDTGEVA